MDSRELYHSLEKVVDKLIPWMLGILLVIIVIEVWFHDIAEQYHTLIQVIDFIIVATFVLDLTFKWRRIRHIKPFVRKCWPDILAVFPFFLLFRFFGSLQFLSKAFGESIETAQSILHEGVAIEKEGSKVAGTVERSSARVAAAVEKQGTKVARFTRSDQLTRFIRPVLRSPRFAKAVPFFEEPIRKKHSSRLRKKT